MNTKDKILNKALELFNSEGSSNISTNHIAKALDMSTGNLYYHFKNKESIIRTLLQRMIEEYDEVFRENFPKKEDMILESLLFDDTKTAIKYKFLYNELNILFKRDRELEAIFIENQTKREKVFNDIFKFLQEKEYIQKNISDFVLNNAIKIIWYLENFRFFRYELEGRDVKRVEDLDLQEILLERLIPIYGLLTDKGKVYFESEKYLR
ncbi:MAG: TetR/AcrR family transcriptional regulator [Fusobacteriaceae bacterium]|jgi:AcrR family transcriptional regulator|nr:TetR/AcrR family transcriptional regulator [Fusobacteriaceae bacterium]MBP6467274.1 TetR/AcrR family transcriptional regulator [Fusobacteriaceae bacterium]MBP9596585.1 TetR/AcrR family transcriptional regulator [Fusobacteriaceae bacterium]MBU9918388.1 TetR/AcrR family transcriptional regulator [Fusobacteriaceae bacterium]